MYEFLDRLLTIALPRVRDFRGVSRKSFIARSSVGEPPAERLGGSLAAASWGLTRGVHILRVHDVAETAQAVRVLRTIVGEGGEAAAKN